MNIQAAIDAIKAKGIEVLVYEPELDASEFFGSRVTHDLDELKAKSDIIIANRRMTELADVANKVFTRDLFGSD